jgi:hypothetical protein
MNYPALLQLLSQVIGAVENIASAHPSGLPSVMRSMSAAKTQVNTLQQEHADAQAPEMAPADDPVVAEPDAPADPHWAENMKTEEHPAA